MTILTETAQTQTHGEFLPYLMNRVISQINAPMQRELKRRGMTMTHWRVLGFLAERDGLIISELAERTVTDQATLSRALDRLQERGLIRRQVVEQDSRQTEIHLCPAGREQYEALVPVACAIEDWAFQRIDASQRAQLRQILETISHTLGASVEQSRSADTDDDAAHSAA